MQRSKLLRTAFWAFWFGLVPLLLAWAAVDLLKSDDAFTPGLVSRVRFWLDDQRIPALIVFFTVFEMTLYRWRHRLPLASQVGAGGRPDVPARLRHDYEQALQLLDESMRLLRKNRRAVERNVPAPARADLDDALDSLRAEVEAERFVEEGFVEASARASTLVARHLGPWRKSELREYAESIIVAILVAMLLRAFVVEAFKIPSASMLPTLQIQDHIFVNKLVYGPPIPYTERRLFQRLPPGRGDVMVFEFPENRADDYIKRAVAFPGDTLVVRAGHPFINGWMVPHCFVGALDDTAGGGHSDQRGLLYMEYYGDYSYLTLHEDGRHSGESSATLSPGKLFEDSPDAASRFDPLDEEGPYRVDTDEVWVLGDNRDNSSDSRAWNNRRGGGVPFPLIKGRAMFVWLSFSPNRFIQLGRILHDVMGRPSLPKAQTTPAIQAGIDECLAKRPANTLPPRPAP
ncbi:MAG: signal peptidase I [Polyangiaceae bacterium]|nr:signal peptidase I [Polyangiaceae bacterium]